MKSEELMIGDWYYWEAEGKKYPLQVTKETFALADEDIANFQPIPLTVEILEKSGFIREKWRRNDNSLVITYELDYDIYIELFDHQFRLVHNLEDDPDFGYSADILIEINFVHQLQHLIKDLEIEEEVIL